jgi:hypothetical protein
LNKELNIDSKRIVSFGKEKKQRKKTIIKDNGYSYNEKYAVKKRTRRVRKKRKTNTRKSKGRLY